MGKSAEQTGKKDIAGFIEERSGVFTALSDAIWDEPETAFAETNAASALSRALETFGFSVERGIGGLGTAFRGTFSAGSGPVLGFLGEYDALFNMSQKPGATEKEEIAGGGCGHGCGHNLLGVASLAAAAAVVEFMKKSGKGGTVKYFGCPGEEGGSGKAFMAKEGVFDGLDAAITWHPSPINSVMHLGTLANYQVLYKFKGLSAHAASAPHLGRSALDAAELMNVGVNFLREHVPSDARFHYAITNSGGRSPNVVQAEAGVLYLIRAPKLEGVEDIYRRINKIAQGAAMMTETEVEIVFIKACANVIPNNVISECLYENLKSVALPRYTEEELSFARKIRESLPHLSQDLETFSNLSGRALDEENALMRDKVLCDRVVTFDPGFPERDLMGSSDVGDVSWGAPTGQLSAACYALGTPMHSWQAVSQGRTSIAHKGMLTAAKAMAGAAADILLDPDIAARAKKEFDERMAGRVYKSPIPDGTKPMRMDDI